MAIKAVITRLPKELHKKLKLKAIEQDTTMQDMLTSAAEQYIDGSLQFKPKRKKSFASWIR